MDSVQKRDRDRKRRQQAEEEEQRRRQRVAERRGHEAGRPSSSPLPAVPELPAGVPARARSLPPLAGPAARPASAGAPAQAPESKPRPPSPPAT